MTRRNVYSVVIALLLAATALSAQQSGQYTLKLPAGLSVTDATGGKMATLRYANAQQTFDAQAGDVSVTMPTKDVLMVTMTAGDFTWATAGHPTYKNKFQHLELKFDNSPKANMISFRIVD